MKKKTSKSLLAALLLLPMSVMADPPLWDPIYGADTGLVADDNFTIVTLGFVFPFDGSDYDSLAINTNGGVSLGVAGIFAGGEYIEYDHWEDDEFMDNFPLYGNPTLIPLNTDLDNGSGVGTIHFKTDDMAAVITWDGIASYWNDTQPFATFQIIMRSDGTFTYSWFSITADLTVDLNEGIVVGVSDGLDLIPPLNSDLSGGVNIDLMSATVYELWCWDQDHLAWDDPDSDCFTADMAGPTRPDNWGFDLITKSLTFTPNMGGGFDIVTMSPPPPDPPPDALPDYSVSGCSLGSPDGTIDPTLPLLVLVSLVWILNRRVRRARI